jgi:hypothetical protein
MSQSDLETLLEHTRTGVDAADAAGASRRAGAGDAQRAGRGRRRLRTDAPADRHARVGDAAGDGAGHARRARGSGHETLFPLDAELNLPAERYCFGIRRRAAEATKRGLRRGREDPGNARECGFGEAPKWKRSCAGTPRTSTATIWDVGSRGPPRPGRRAKSSCSRLMARASRCTPWICAPAGKSLGDCMLDPALSGLRDVEDARSELGPARPCFDRSRLPTGH